MKATLTSALLLAALSGTMLVSAGQVSADDNSTSGTSTANFTVDATTDPTTDNGKLVLKEAPSFDFGAVKSTDIYNGFTAKTSTATDNLIISDTRASTDDWTLTAALGAFSDGTNSLTGATLNLGSLTGSIAGTSTTATAITDTTSTAIATSAGIHGTNTYKVGSTSATLDLAANSGATLSNGAAYNSTITWTLASSGPVAPVAS